MNLNFIQDSDKIHVETQNQVAYKEEIILKIKLLKQDFQDYSSINPSLNSINQLFSSIVKDLYEHVANCSLKNSSDPPQGFQAESQKKKKKIPIPYNTIKKLQTLKQKFITCKNIIHQQNLRYRSLNMNRENEKNSEVKFYKNVLGSYEAQRQYYKKQTSDLEDRVQQIEAEVKTVSYNENHQFTDFHSRVLSLESVFKYEKKMNAVAKVLDEIKLVKIAKHKISAALQNQLNEKRSLQTENITPKNNQRQSILKEEGMFYAKNFIKNATEMQKKINLLKITKTQILQRQFLKLKNSISKAQNLNNKLKKAILQSQSETYFRRTQEKILSYKSNQQHQTSNKQNNKITRTDFLIYLKELDAQIKGYFKRKEIVFNFKQTNASKQRKSKSVQVLRI